MEQVRNRSQPGLQLENLRVDFGALRAVDQVSLEVIPGEHLTLIGPSGSGKTTLLRCVAGLIRPGEGVVRWKGKIWSAPEGIWRPPEERRIGMMTQVPALWPHLTALDHLLLALRWRGVNRSARSVAARNLLDLVSLSERAGHRPPMLSGGESQRLALARALAGGSELLLLDEPLGHLDVALRGEMAQTIVESARTMGATLLHVTHDPAEAMNLADRVAVLEQGRLTQIATPSDLLARPATRFAAAVTGRSNVVPVERLPELAALLGINADESETVVLQDGSVAFSPDRLVVAPGGQTAEVLMPVFAGGRWLLRVRLGQLELQVAHDRSLPRGSRIEMMGKRLQAAS